MQDSRSSSTITSRPCVDVVLKELRESRYSVQLNPPNMLQAKLTYEAENGAVKSTHLS